MSILPSPIPHPLDFCPWDLPGWCYEALEWVVGFDWPEGNEKETWDVADAWYAAAQALAGPRDEAAAAAGEVLAGYGGTGLTAEAFRDAWTKLSQGDDAPLVALLSIVHEIGKLCEETGCEIEGAKIEAWIELGIFVAELLALAVTVVLTLGAASPAAAGIVAATRIAIQQIFKRLVAQLGRKALKQTLKVAGERATKQLTSKAGLRRMGRELLDEGFDEAREEAAINLGVQAYQNSTGRRDGLDLGELGMSTWGGFAGGAAAGVVGAGHGSGLPGGMFRGARGEVAGEIAGSLATGGGLPGLEDLGKAATSGAAGSAVGAGQHAASGARADLSALASLDPSTLGGGATFSGGADPGPGPASTFSTSGGPSSTSGGPSSSGASFSGGGAASGGSSTGGGTSSSGPSAGPSVAGPETAGSAPSHTSAAPLSTGGASTLGYSGNAASGGVDVSLAGTVIADPVTGAATTGATGTAAGTAGTTGVATGGVSTGATAGTGGLTAAATTVGPTTVGPTTVGPTTVGPTTAGPTTTGPAAGPSASPALSGAPSTVSSGGPVSPTTGAPSNGSTGATVSPSLGGNQSAPPTTTSPTTTNPNTSPNTAGPRTGLAGATSLTPPSNPGPSPSHSGPSTAGPAPGPSVSTTPPTNTPPSTTSSATSAPNATSPSTSTTTPSPRTPVDPVANGGSPQAPTQRDPGPQQPQQPPQPTPRPEAQNASSTVAPAPLPGPRRERPPGDASREPSPDLSRQARDAYFGYAANQRANYELIRREERAEYLRWQAEQRRHRVNKLNDEAATARAAGFDLRADYLRRQAVEASTEAYTLDDEAAAVMAGTLRPQRTDVDNHRDWSRLNDDLGVLAHGGLETSDVSALTGSDRPPSVDSTRPYNQRGGLRPPLAAHQIDLERAMPRDAAGNVVRTADPRQGNWFRLANDGGPSADPTRSINCQDCVLSFFDTWVHGRPRVSAPRTFDAYANGDPNRPLDGEYGSVGRAEDLTGGSYQNLYASQQGVPPAQAREQVFEAMGHLHYQLLDGGHGSFAFIVHAWEGGSAHAWAAINQNGTILYVDPQSGYISENIPLYGHYGQPDDRNIVAMDALITGPNGDPMPLPHHPPGLWSTRQPVDEEPTPDQTERDPAPETGTNLGGPGDRSGGLGSPTPNGTHPGPARGPEPTGDPSQQPAPGPQPTTDPSQQHAPGPQPTRPAAPPVSGPAVTSGGTESTVDATPSVASAMPAPAGPAPEPTGTDPTRPGTETPGPPQASAPPTPPQPRQAPAAETAQTPPTQNAQTPSTETARRDSRRPFDTPYDRLSGPRPLVGGRRPEDGNRVLGSHILRDVRAEYEQYREAIAASGRRVAIIRFAASDEDPPGWRVRMEASRVSAEQKVKNLSFLGFQVDHVVLPGDVSEAEFAALLDQLNADPDNAATIVQFPPPPDLVQLVQRMSPEHDIDSLVADASQDRACATAEGIWRVVEPFLDDRPVVAVVGAAGFVGHGVTTMLRQHGIEPIELDRGDDLSRVTEADIVISVTGQAGILGPEHIRPHHRLVVDSGFVPGPDGEVRGDIQPEARDIPQNVTPVPRGIGPVEMAILLERAVRAVVDPDVPPWRFAGVSDQPPPDPGSAPPSQPQGTPPEPPGAGPTGPASTPGATPSLGGTAPTAGPDPASTGAPVDNASDPGDERSAGDPAGSTADGGGLDGVDLAERAADVLAGLARTELLEHEPLPVLGGADFPVRRDADGLITEVRAGGAWVPLPEFLAELTRERSRLWRRYAADTDFPGIRKANAHPCISLAVDRATGKITEGHNNLRVTVDELHPLLRDRLERYLAEGAARTEPYDWGSPFRHPSVPGTHAEIYAVNELLWTREAMGHRVDDSALPQLRIDNHFPWFGGGKSAPCCGNCTALIPDVPCNAGKLPYFKAPEDEKWPE